MELKVTNPFNDEVIAEVPLAGKREVEQAIRQAVYAFEQTKNLPSYTKAEILTSVAQKIRDARAEFAKTISLEAGKPIQAALAEVDRAVSTFAIAAEEAQRIDGEYLPLDISAAANRRFGIVRRFPIGLIAAISPFNFPLNLVAHKVAPAIAAGNPIVLKPASKTPLSALKLAGLIAATAWPRGAFQVVIAKRETGELLVTDKRFKMLSFTGSPAVGWQMKERAGARKKVVLELGGNAAVVIDKTGAIGYAIERTLVGAFAYAGQSCISVQRIYIHQDVFEEFVSEFVGKVKLLTLGDPLDPKTDVGPLIDDKAVVRTAQWVKEAVEKGGKLLCGGKARGRMFEPTVLTNVPSQAKICSQEVFAPLVVIFPYSDPLKVLNAVNDSVYGLQTGIFTNNQHLIWEAFERLDVGGVIINDVPTFRVDHYPYGGVKESGFGREGVKYAIEEMTERKILVINRDYESF